MRNRIEMNDGVCEMVITSPKYGEKRVRIDVEDVERVQEHRWCLHPVKQKDRMAFYVYCDPLRKELHRFLIAGDSALHVDHIDGNRLNNRKANLRLVTHQENQFNQTRARGYTWHKRVQKWQSQIVKDGRLIYLGLFNTEPEARAAYLAAKDVHHRIASE
jgi:hypothetical protein